MNNKKLKIGILMDTTMDTNDGVQQYIKALGRWLIKDGHDVRFLVGESENTGEFEGKIITIGKTINIKSNGNKLSPAVIPDKVEIENLLTNEHFDIFHLQMPYSPSVSGYVIKSSNVPVVGTFHILPNNALITFSNYLFNWILGRQIRKFKKVIAVSHSAKAFFDRIYRQESIVIPNMVDLQKFQTTEKLEEFDDGKINILFFGRLVERKGALYLLKAIRILREKIDMSDVRILIAGDGHQRNLLQSFVELHEIENVEFLGYIDENDKAKVYNSSDICVFPAIGGESFGIVLIEAMASGKPVIAFSNPGYASVMGLTKNEDFLAENKNPEDLAGKLMMLIKSEDLRKKVSENNTKEVLQFEVDTVCKQILEVYYGALGDN